MVADRSRENSCTGKYKFSSKSHAKKAAKRIMEQDPLWFMRVYHCSFCSCWHTGRSRKVEHSDDRLTYFSRRHE